MSWSVRCSSRSNRGFITHSIVRLSPLDKPGFCSLLPKLPPALLRRISPLLEPPANRRCHLIVILPGVRNVPKTRQPRRQELLVIGEVSSMLSLLIPVIMLGERVAFHV